MVDGLEVRGLTFKGGCVGGVLPPWRRRASLQLVGGVVLHKGMGDRPSQYGSCGAKAPYALGALSDPGIPRRAGCGTLSILHRATHLLVR